MIRFHWPIIDPSRCRYDEMNATLVAAAQQVQRLLAIDDVDVMITLGERFAIRQWGIGGYTSGPARITIFIDPDNPHFAELATAGRLSATLAHELHHAARMRGPGYGKTLGEALVTEGLAQVFEQESGQPTAFYSIALSSGALRTIGERALRLLDDPSYDHAAWFMGRAGDPLYPRHGGYALAYALVMHWVAANATTAAASAVIDAGHVLRAWRSGSLRLWPALVASSPIP